MYFFCIRNSAVPKEMSHYVSFHLGLHCLEKNAFNVSPVYKLYFSVLILHDIPFYHVGFAINVLKNF